MRRAARSCRVVTRWLAVATSVALALAAGSASADTVGVVVTGDPLFQGPVAARVESWLRAHAYGVVPTPLDADGFTSIGNCLLLDDLDCARSVIETRATSDTVIYVRIETADSDMGVSAWWFVKGHDATHDHGQCKDCAPDGWRAILDTVLISITGANINLGHLDLRSHPIGVIARIDGKRIGKTPVALDVASGDHVIVLERDGQRLARRAVTITPGESTAIDIPVPPVSPRAKPATDGGAVSNAGELVAIIAGAGAVLGGGYIIYYGHKDDAAYDFPHATPIGGAIAAAGLAALITGAVLYDRGPPARAPVVAITPGGALVGFRARF